MKLLLARFGSALHTRLDLFVTELEEERERLKHSLTLAFLVIVGLAFGFVLLNVFVVALFWQQGWIAAIGVLALLYFGVACAAALRLRSAILRRRGLFPATLAELGKDCEQLRESLRDEPF
ncbi:MAG TPA: phage holin family protein [Candidatus Binatia bacterium]